MTTLKRIYKLVCKANWEDKDEKSRRQKRHRNYVNGEIEAYNDAEALTTLGHIAYIDCKELQGRDRLEIMVGCAEDKDRYECCRQSIDELRKVIIAWYDGEMWNTSHPFELHFLTFAQMSDYAVRYSTRTP